MYSPKIAALTLYRLAPKLSFKLPGFFSHDPLSSRPILYASPYSNSETQERSHIINSLLNPESGRLARDLTPDESLFVEHERHLAKYSFPHFLSNYSTLIDNDGHEVHPTPTPAQRITMDIWAWLQEQSLAIMILQLKARQLGVTSLVGQAILHRTLFYRNAFNYIASSDEDNTRDKMGGKIVFSLLRLPWFLIPSNIKGPFESGETLFECPTLGSFIAVQHGRQKKGIGRGDTTTCVHLTEISEFQHPEQIVDAALLKTFHPTPRHFMTLEFTAEGKGTWAHKLWEGAKENWPRRRSMFFPLFLPWFVDEEFWPTGTWLRQHNLSGRPEPPRDWEPEPRTLAMQEKAEDYVQATPYISKFLGSDWKMPRKKLFFWEVDRAEHERKNELSIFLSEMPSNDLEAWQSRKRGIFNAEFINDLTTRTRAPLAVYGLLGDKVSAELTPSIDEIDDSPGKSLHKISALWDGERTYNFTLYPMKYSNYPEIVWDNRFLLWEEPREGYDYSIGVDTGDGIGRNLTAIEVLRTRPGEPDVQVAEYASAWASALDVWPHLYALASWYSAPSRKQCRVAIECADTGDALQKDMRLSGWSNFHIWIRWDNRVINKSRSRKVGWFTLGWSRKALMEHTIKAIKSHWIILNSTKLIDELGNLETDDALWDARADDSNILLTDDRFFATGISFMSVHELDKRKGEWTPAKIEAPPVEVRSDTMGIDLTADTMDDWGETEDDRLHAVGW